jgi:hypothetical protein
MSALSVAVIYARALKAGDLYAGTVSESGAAQPNARALPLDHAVSIRDEWGTLWVHAASGGMELSPVKATGRVLVIRQHGGQVG